MRVMVLSLLLLLVSVAAGCGDWYRALDKANEMRARHSSPVVQWDWALSKAAMDRADQLAASNFCNAESITPAADETVLSGSMAATCMAAVEKWYHDGDGYTYSSQPYTDNAANGAYSFESFTKLLWSSTESMGCASATSDSCGTVVVCKWRSAGNVPTDAAYLANVHPAADLQQQQAADSSITSRRAVLLEGEDWGNSGGHDDEESSADEWLEESSEEHSCDDEESSEEELSLEESSDEGPCDDEESSEEEESSDMPWDEAPPAEGGVQLAARKLLRGV